MKRKRIILALRTESGGIFELDLMEVFHITKEDRIKEIGLFGDLEFPCIISRFGGNNGKNVTKR